MARKLTLKRLRKRVLAQRRDVRHRITREAHRRGLKLTKQEIAILVDDKVGPFPSELVGAPKPGTKEERRREWNRREKERIQERDKRVRDSYTDREAALTVLGFVSYRQYLGSPLWKSIKDRILVGRCRICKRRPAKVIHHQSYDLDTMLGNRLEHLIALCHSCHHEVELTSNGHKRAHQDAVVICARRLKRKKK